MQGTKFPGGPSLQQTGVDRTCLKSLAHVIGLHGQFGLVGVLLWCERLDMLKTTPTSVVPSLQSFLSLIPSLTLISNTFASPL